MSPDSETRIREAVAELADALLASLHGGAAAVPEAAARERLYGVNAAAEMLGVGRSFIYSEIAAGRLGSVHAGRRRLISSGAIAEYIAAREASS